MKRTRIGWMGLAMLLSGGAMAAPPDANRAGEPFIVHEWGTLLTMNGSDGVVLDSMYHEEHSLPDFVHALTQDQLYPPEALFKFETPVIYFYTDRPRSVDVTVKFLTGIWTHWFPQAEIARNFMAKPDANPTAKPFTFSTGKEPIRRGTLRWKAELLPPTSALESLLPHTPGDSLWNFARQVDAAFVRTAPNRTDAQARNRSKSRTISEADLNPQSPLENRQSKIGNQQSAINPNGLETERYLFYRGLGTAHLPLQVDASNGGTLSLPSNGGVTLTHLFVLRVENGKGAFRYIPALKPGEKLDHALPDTSAAESLPAFTSHVSDALAAKLAASGLYAKEARAMVNTWRSSYFQSNGVRVLYVLPQTWTEAFIPMQITPTPDRLVRVMVGRTELLTPDREQQITQAVRAWADPNPALHNGALQTLHAQGRYLQPILRRLLQTAPDAAVKANCRALLQTAWVNVLAPTPLTK